MIIQIGEILQNVMGYSITADSLANFYHVSRIIGATTVIGGALGAFIRYTYKLYSAACSIQGSVEQLTNMDMPHITWGIEGIKTEISDMRSDVKILGTQLGNHDDRLAELKRASETMGIAFVNHLDNGTDAKVRQAAEAAIQTVAKASAIALTTVSDAAASAKKVILDEADEAKKVVLSTAKEGREPRASAKSAPQEPVSEVSVKFGADGIAKRKTVTKKRKKD